MIIRGDSGCVIPMAFLGTAAVFSSHSADPGLALCLEILAGVVWASVMVVIRCSALSAVPATHTLFYLLAGGVLLLLAACGSGQLHAELTAMVISSMLFQAVIVSFASYLTSRPGVLAFMTPVSGVPGRSLAVA